MGEFVERAADKQPTKHKCNPPMTMPGYGRPSPNASVGDVWRCDCGKHWTVIRYKPGRGYAMRSEWVRKRPALWKRLFGVKG